jgi:hypothetical protein
MGLILHPIRTLIIILVAFLAGIVYERSSQSDRCLDRGGRMDNNLCVGSS